MKHLIEYPNAEDTAVAFLHFDYEVTSPHVLERHLLRLSGVSSVSAGRYSVVITKGRLFDWGSIMPAVLAAVEHFFGEPSHLASAPEGTGGSQGGDTGGAAPLGPQPKTEEHPSCTT